ncbi:thioredoxin-like protein [Crepidotus variabilis]|uniref:Thioredoxin-like protein n=1 Tax=Crepidotus variabilis TaxID=179855 RepID=A0A9P6EE76_9AGAR|nr:thioredoxin-like protein [Crepidotus variabilis]
MGLLRRRRLTLILIFLGALFFYFVPWEMPAALVRTKQVDEIYGFLHLFTGPNEEGPTVTTTVLQLDPFSPNELIMYAAGDAKLSWKKEQTRIDKQYPVVVFSKTYCPYSKRAKALLEKYDLQPPPRIVEVDLREDSNDVKQFLARLTGQGTFPNVVVKGKSIGGSSELQELHNTEKLKALFEEAGVKVKGDPRSV